MSLRKFLQSNPLALRIWSAGANFLASIHWPRFQAVLNGGIYYKLKEQDLDNIRRLLKEHYCLILTRRSSHLTTYLIYLISWLATRRASHYTHALMNVEGDIPNHIDFKLVEATGRGVHYSTFLEVFDCDSVCVLAPRGVDLVEWTLALQAARDSIGEAYDLLFDLNDEKKVTCVAMCYKAMKHLPDYEVRFPKLLELLKNSNGDLTPQMLYDCGDLDVVFEARR
jgi:hypothetical protein